MAFAIVRSDCGLKRLTDGDFDPEDEERLYKLAEFAWLSYARLHLCIDELFGVGRKEELVETPQMPNPTNVAQVQDISMIIGKHHGEIHVIMPLRE